MRYLAALTINLVCFNAIAHAAEQKPATAAYVKRVAASVDHLLDTELSKHPERLKTVSIKLRYEVDQHGRVQRVEILSAKPDRSAANTVERVIRASTFPPFPQDVLREGVSSVEGELNWTRSPGNPDDSPYYRYTLRVHKVLEQDAIQAFGTPSHRLEVDYEFYLDPKGRMVSLKTTPRLAISGTSRRLRVASAG